MKKSQLKRIIALCLSVTVLMTETKVVFAGNTDAAAYPLPATGEAAASVRPIGTPLTDITEDEALAFERGLTAEFFDAVGADSDLSKNAKKKAAAFTSLYGETSVQYAVMQKGELVLSDVYGTDDAAKKTNATTDSLYGIASISKMFTTVAVQKLVEERKIDLDQPVVTYIPEFKMKDERYKDITVRMLLNHSSGLFGGNLENVLLFEDADTSYHDHFLDKLAGETLKADPGAYSVYCNDGFLLAELVVERVSGKSFTDYLQDQIFKPLGLSHTRTPLQIGAADTVAGAYLTKGGKKLPTEYLNSIGAGGLFSNAEDLCRFGMTFTEHNGALLSAASVTETMEQEGRKGQWCEEYSGMMNYGLGWDSVNTYPFADYGIQAMEKGGDSLMYHGELMVFPAYDLSVAVLSSGGSSSYDAIFAQYLAKEYLKAQGVLSDEMISAVPAKYTVSKQKVPAELAAYNGYYTSMGMTYKVKLTTTGLTLVNLTDKKTTMKFTYSKDGYFVYPGGAQALKFMTQKGKKYLMAGTYGTLPGVGTSFSYMYIGQKSATKKLSAPVKKAWQERDDKKYFVLTEKYSSVMYAAGGAINSLDMDVCQPGYFYNDKIVNADTAIEFTDMPMNCSRDARNYTFTKQADGNEYMQCGDMYAVREDALKNLPDKSSFTVTIDGAEGYAKWYRIRSKQAGKTIRLTLPKDQGAMVSVYDADAGLKLNTYISGAKSVKLPKNGYVVFAGDKGASIKVKIK